VEQIFTDLALAQRSSPRVTEIHRPTRSSTRGTVLTAPGYKHPKTPKSNDIGTKQHQIQQSTENNPTAGEPYKSQHALALGQNVQIVELLPAPLAPKPVGKTVLETVLNSNKQATAYT
jgi:hypothetical protein